MAADTPDQNLSQYFSVCNDFIHSARLRGGNVLIHCLAGMSRSVTVAVAYITSTTNLSWKDALKVVRVGRAVANPNIGFQQQLEDFESNRLQDERRRLRERYPSLALSAQDCEACRLTLISYEGLAHNREVCEGKCVMGRTCPTGLCRQSSKRNLRRKSSTNSQNSIGSGRTPPQTPRLLPSAPPSPALPRSASVAAAACRPRSGPSGLHYYTSSAPPSRRKKEETEKNLKELNVNQQALAVSRVDLSTAVVCSSTNNIACGGSTSSLSAIGRSALIVGSPWRYAVAGSAPATPRATPPVSPQHWPRRMISIRPGTPQLPTSQLATVSSETSTTIT